MTRAIRSDDYPGGIPQALSLAFDLDVSEWKLGFRTHRGATPRGG